MTPKKLNPKKPGRPKSTDFVDQITIRLRKDQFELADSLVGRVEACDSQTETFRLAIDLGLDVLRSRLPTKKRD